MVCRSPHGAGLSIGSGYGEAIAVAVGGSGVSLGGTGVSLGGSWVFVGISVWLGVNVALGGGVFEGVQVKNWVGEGDAVKVGICGMGVALGGRIRVGLGGIEGMAVKVAV